MKKIFFFLSLLFFFLLPGITHADYPQYTGYVNDFAHVLSPDYAQTLEQKLADFDKRTTDQLVVVTVDTTQPETIEEYSIHLADRWKPGVKGKDNGVIMLFAMKDRQMRIEVGRGLEGDLTDIQSKHILSDVIRPQFQQGNYEQGIDLGVNAVMHTIDPTGATPAANTTIHPTTQPDSGTVMAIVTFIIILIVFGIAFSPRTPFGGQGMWGIPGWWIPMGRNDEGDDGGDGFKGFGGGGFSGGGSSDRW